MKKPLLLFSFLFILLSCSKSNDDDILNEDNAGIVATLNTDKGNHTFNNVYLQEIASELRSITLYTDMYTKSLTISIWYASYEGGKNRYVIRFNDGTTDTNGYPNLYSYDSSFPPDNAPEDIINFTIIEDTETNFKANFNGVLSNSYTINDTEVYNTLNIEETLIDITF